MLRLALAILCLTFASSAFAAEIIHLRDGSARRGTLEAQDDHSLRLRLDQEGNRAAITIPRIQVAWIEKIREPLPPAPTTLPAQAPAAQPRQAVAPASPTPPAPSPQPPQAPPPATRPHDPSIPIYGNADTMPRHLQEAWLAAIEAAALDNPQATLDALRRLEEICRDLPNGLQRLNELSTSTRGESFGDWLGRIHWSIISPRFKTGSFDLRDVRDVERPFLIAALRGSTAAALEPLRQWFPPIDDKTGRPQPFNRSQLESITTANALEVRDQAAFASAVLLGQLKLEPDMPAADKAQLGTQLAGINRIFSKARQLEPAARMALQRAETLRKQAEAKARREELKQRRASTGLAGQ